MDVICESNSQGARSLKKNITTRELIKQSRKLAFPKQTLCLIIFDNGEDTNYFIPDDVLNNDTISNAEWWNEKNKDTFIPLIQGEFKAISASPIKEH